MDAVRTKWIDGAKGIAMLMVIAVHLAQALPMLPKSVFQVASFGAMGVQLFFVMTAYCACMTWRPERFNRFYWWRKYKRLAPWYLVGIVGYWLYWLWRGNSDASSAYSFWNVAANVLFVNGFVPSAQNAIVPGGWSISCIATFVFAFPLLAGLSANSRVTLLCVAGLLGGGLSFMGYNLWGWSRFYAYCVPFNQIVPFAVGVFFWHRCAALRERLRLSAAVALAVFFFVLAVASVFLMRDSSIFCRQTFVAFSFMFGLLVLERFERSIPRWLTWIGRHSYEIFILHFAVIWVTADLTWR